MKNNVYDKLKWTVQIALPATSALYFGLSQIWGLPGAEKVVGTLAVLATFLGALIGVAAKKYEASGAAYDGVIHADHTADGQTVMNMDYAGDPYDIPMLKSVRFKVVTTQDGNDLPIAN